MANYVSDFASRAAYSLGRRTGLFQGSVFTVPSDRCACFMHNWPPLDTVKWKNEDPRRLIFEFDYGQSIPSETLESGCNWTNGRYSIRLQSDGQTDDDYIEPSHAPYGPTQKENDAKLAGYSTKMSSLQRIKVYTVGTRNDEEAKRTAPTFTIGLLTRETLDSNLPAFDEFLETVLNAAEAGRLGSTPIDESIGDVSARFGQEDGHQLSAAEHAPDTNVSESLQAQPSTDAQSSGDTEVP